MMEKLCPFCKGPAFLFGMRTCADGCGSARFSTYVCVHCQAGFTIPFPNEAKSRVPPDKLGWASFFLKLFIKERIRKLTRLLTHGRLLDVGCGVGLFLKALQERGGWDLVGYEASSESASLGSKTSPIDIRTGPFKNLFPEKSLHAVTLWHVLEHVFEPDDILREIHRVLKKDGILFVSVPNFQSWQARFFKWHWTYLDIPRHVWQFSFLALTKLLERNGFVIIKRFHHSWEYGPYGWLQSFLNIFFKSNFLYNFLKKSHGYHLELSSLSYVSNILWSFVFGPLIFMVPSVVLSLFESMVGRGAVIEVVAKHA